MDGRDVCRGQHADNGEAPRVNRNISRSRVRCQLPARQVYALLVNATVRPAAERGRAQRTIANTQRNCQARLREAASPVALDDQCVLKNDGAQPVYEAAEGLR